MLSDIIPSRKAQIAIEFLMLFSFMFVVFIVFYKGAFELSIDADQTLEQHASRDIMYKMREEILLAQKASEGYEREFSLPPYLKNKYTYNLTFASNILYVVTENHIEDIRIPSIDVSISNNVKDFVIYKDGDQVYLRNT